MGIVLLGAAVLIVAIVALREPKGHVSGSTTGRTIIETLTPTPTRTPTSGSTSSSRSSTATSARTSSTAATAVKSVPLIVLNNTTTGGLARSAAQRFESGGWTVRSFDNYQNNIASTCAYYDPSVANARAAAKTLQQQYPTIKRVRERFANLPAGPVVVVLTSDYSSS